MLEPERRADDVVVTFDTGDNHKFFINTLDTDGSSTLVG